MTLSHSSELVLALYVFGKGGTMAGELVRLTISLVDGGNLRTHIITNIFELLGDFMQPRQENWGSPEIWAPKFEKDALLLARRSQRI